MRVILPLALGFLAGCLRTPDVEPVVVTWTFDAADTIGCVAGAAEVPEMRIRMHVALSPAADDEYIQWVPCVVVDPVSGLERHDAAITPLELGTYDVEVEMWTDHRRRRVAQGHSVAGLPMGTAILNDPTQVTTVDMVMVSDPIMQPGYIQLP